MRKDFKAQVIVTNSPEGKNYAKNFVIDKVNKTLCDHINIYGIGRFKLETKIKSFFSAPESDMGVWNPTAFNIEVVLNYDENNRI